ncbi:transporter substrate-binding domain-containing protein [Burkholderia gladioli]|uniref:transporter substrate-binding domain-containing protein n=1 Tax=Burkholderia gladioli TaxID=28095 RepID=UPI00163F72DC
MALPIHTHLGRHGRTAPYPKRSSVSHRLSCDPHPPAWALRLVGLRRAADRRTPPIAGHPRFRAVGRVLARGLIALGLVLGDGQYASAQGQVLRVVTDANYPPMEFFKDGKRTGFDIDIVEALAKDLGDSVQWIDIDFKGLIPAVQAGRADLAASALYITDDRRQVVDFTAPYYAGGLVVVTRPDGPIKTVKDLDGRTVSVQVGTKSVNFMKEHYPKVIRVEVDQNQEMFNLVLIRRADAIITGKPAAVMFAHSVPDMTVLPEQLTTEQYGLATPKNRPELTASLNGALKHIQADGTYARIVGKWFGGTAR